MRKGKKWRREQERRHMEERMGIGNTVQTMTIKPNLVQPGKFDPFNGSQIPSIANLPKERLVTKPIGDLGFVPAKHNSRSGPLEVPDRPATIWRKSGLNSGKQTEETAEKLKSSVTDKKSISIIEKILNLVARAGGAILDLVHGFLSMILSALKHLSPSSLRSKLSVFLWELGSILYPN